MININFYFLYKYLGYEMYFYTLKRIDSIFNNEKILFIVENFRYLIFIDIFIFLLHIIKPSFLLSGFLLSLFGEFIQIWSFASLEKNTTLAFRGPYSLTRNPMYIGRFFLLFGIVLLVGEIWIIIVFVMIYYFYVTNRVRREEKRLLEIFQEDYQSYCSTVKRFVPSFKHANLKSLIYFNRNLFLRNNGHWNLLGFLFLYFFFYVFILFREIFIKGYA